MSERDENQTSPSEVRCTVLHDWHQAHGAKMVDFAGWRMPVQYASGIIGEHLATRRRAGVFDISHMGRFYFTGPDAERFLRTALTNDAGTLAPGEAHYTFLATETGGAVDDAFLYRLDPETFVLVVNASNREKDWGWLQRLRANRAHAFDLEDRSDAQAMISLQGPQASEVLERMVPRSALPERKRNRLVTLPADSLIVARTGYTGESVCFELFCPTEHALDLWTKLVAHGATPVGLGARDSLRLEAGLPLYGHELGNDIEGTEIPLFANSMARFAVRSGLGDDYVGAAALAQQRSEYERIRAGELDLPVPARVLKRLVQPIAVMQGRRPLRAGHTLSLDDREVGYVTSGTVVPQVCSEDEAHRGSVKEFLLRPMGLALIDSDITYHRGHPVVLQVTDERGRTQACDLVARNLPPAASPRHRA